MKAHDVRHLRLCAHCGRLGDNRKMLQLADSPCHDHCIVQTLSADEVFELPAVERGKITLGAAGPELMVQLLALVELGRLPPAKPGASELSARIEDQCP